MQMLRISGPATDSGRVGATGAYQHCTPGFKEQAIGAAAPSSRSGGEPGQQNQTLLQLTQSDSAPAGRTAQNWDRRGEDRNSPPLPCTPALFQAFQLRKSLGQKTRIITIARGLLLFMNCACWLSVPETTFPHLSGFEPPMPDGRCNFWPRALARSGMLVASPGQRMVSMSNLLICFDFVQVFGVDPEQAFSQVGERIGHLLQILQGSPLHGTGHQLLNPNCFAGFGLQLLGKCGQFLKLFDFDGNQQVFVGRRCQSVRLQTQGVSWPVKLSQQLVVCPERVEADVGEIGEISDDPSHFCVFPVNLE